MKHANKIFLILTIFISLFFTQALFISCPQVAENQNFISQVVFEPNGGTINQNTKITLSCATPNVEIYYSKKRLYSINYSTDKDGTKYDENGFTLNESATIYAIAVDSSGKVSKSSEATFTVTSSSFDGPSESNTNANSSELGEYAILLSSAKINTENTYVEHTVSYNSQTVLNYNFEWNSQLKHAIWSGFYFDSELIESSSGVTRSDKMSKDEIYPTGIYGFQPDPQVPVSSGGTDLSDYTSDGYDRGHIIASADRFYDQTANNQTFYLTNMSPQIGDFNQGFWGKVEDKVRSLSENALSSGYSRVYITKGGDTKTLLKVFTGTKKANDGQYPTADSNGFSSKGLAVPSAYYTVLLAEKDSQDTENSENYITLGFYVPHKEGLTNTSNNSEIQKYVYSIDEIEEKTGLDFFCNLIDSVEDEVESRSKETCIASWTW